MRHWSDDSWSDEDAGPIVRPYTLTGGRTAPARDDLEMISLISTIRLASRTDRLQPEQHRVLALCRAPMAVVELSARLDLPVSVVKVLLGDLLDNELVTVSGASAAADPGIPFLQAVLDGIRRL